MKFALALAFAALVATSPLSPSMLSKRDDFKVLAYPRSQCGGNETEVTGSEAGCYHFPRGTISYKVVEAGSMSSIIGVADDKCYRELIHNSIDQGCVQVWPAGTLVGGITVDD